MKLMNALYQSTDNWFIYSNFIYEDYKDKKIKAGISKPIKPSILATNTYRYVVGLSWVTSALRTYRQELYAKIPTSYFFEEEAKFYTATSDRLEMYAIVELAGA